MSANSSLTQTKPAEVVRVTVIGAGSSSSTPRMGCVVNPTQCAICAEARANPMSRNHRLNPSLLIQVRGKDETDSGEQTRIPQSAAVQKEGDLLSMELSATAVPESADVLMGSSRSYSIHEGPSKSEASKQHHHRGDVSEYLNILIDCGKSFRESSMRQFPALGVQNLHALLLTHDHADAVFGVDDLREFTGTQVRVPMPVYLDHKTDETMRRVFGYLYPKMAANDGRWVAALEWLTFEQGAMIPVRVRGPPTKRMKAKVAAKPVDERIVGEESQLLDLTLPVTSFPIEHGPQYLSNGFIFELAPNRLFCYFSDISRFDESDEARLRAHLGKDKSVEILVLDLLATTGYFSHFSKDQALKCAAKIRAKRTYFVGMSHTIDYHKVNAEIEASLAKEGLVGSLAFDGLVVFDATTTA